jgi:hypothetical protein
MTNKTVTTIDRASETALIASETSILSISVALQGELDVEVAFVSLPVDDDDADRKPQH